MNHPKEPTADMRTPASALWQLFVALTSEGFSETQALRIIIAVLQTNTPRNNP